MTRPTMTRPAMTRHGRFFLAFGIGVALAIMSLMGQMSGALHALIGANGFFLAYLALMLRYARATGPGELRRHGASADEGVALILLLTGAAVALSLTAILLVLNAPSASGLAEKVAALLAVPLGWSMVQTLAGFHYAHHFYRRDADGIREGLVFPGTAEPGPADFLYLAFGIGMTAQVSDVQVTTTAMRREVLVHSVTSFFYNTVLLALAVNAALSMGE